MKAIRVLVLLFVCLSSSACSSSLVLSSLGLGMGVAQKSVASTVYSGVDVGVSATTGKSIREHVLEPAEEENKQVVVPDNRHIEWVTPK